VTARHNLPGERAMPAAGDTFKIAGYLWFFVLRGQ